MDSIPGDQWIGEYARWLRVHEAKLGDVAASVAAAKRTAAVRAGRDPSAPALSSTFWSVLTLGTATGTAAGSNNSKSSTSSSTASTLAARPMLLRQNPHNLFYLLIRFEELGLPTGSLDTKIPIVARPTSYFSFVAATAADKDRDDTMSMSSMRSRMSAVSSSFSSSLSWFGASSSKPDPSKDLKYIYSCFTKIPSLRIGAIPARKLIQDFEDCPGQSAVPLDVFKNLQTLELDDVDPRTLIGWDKACIQLRSLTCKKSNIEDLTDLLVDLVVVDVKRGRGEKVDLKRLRQQAPPTDPEEDPSATNTTAYNTDTEDNITETLIEPSSAASMAGEGSSSAAAAKEATPTIPKDLPSLAWHFLRHLNLSSNNLTFVPVEPLLCLSALTNLDLSSNLLNVVPPSLSHLPALTSLNMADNLVDSVLGIYDALPAIRVLNLSKNRLESLCGLERLYSLQRIDLRGNAIYEAGEVGRLAPLPSIAEVWVKDNPLVEELVDYRVDCFVEFAQEGRSITLDGEAPGFFEKQRIDERVPNAAALLAQARSAGGRKADPASGTTRGNTKATNEMDEENEAQLAKDVATSSRSAVIVKNVRHRAAARSANTKEARGRSELLKVPGSAQSEEAGTSSSRSPSRDGSRQQGASGAGRRKNHRVIELDSSPRKPSAASKRERTLTESDRIKQAALNSFAAQAGSAPPSNDRQQATNGAGTSSSGLASVAADGSMPNHDDRSETTSSEARGKATSTPSDAEALSAHGMTLLALPPGLASSDSNSTTSSPSRPGQQRTFTSRRNPIDSSTLGRKSAARPLASDLFATSSNAPTAITATDDDTSKGDEASKESPADLARHRIARPRIGSTAALARRSHVTTSLYDPDLHLAEPSSSSPPSDTAEQTGAAASVNHDDLSSTLAKLELEVGAGSNRSDAFRRRIEALKSEVGDDWLRLLARGGGAAGDRNSALLAVSEAAEETRDADAALTRVISGKKKKKKKNRASAEYKPDESGGRRREARIT